MKPCRIAILGSTGSIGLNTLKVVDHNSKRFQVVALSAYNNFELLGEQIKKYKPSHVAIGPEGLIYFKNAGIKGVKFYPSQDCGYLASLKEVDVVVLAMRGVSALMPFLEALRAGKTVAPANKEALVIAGDLIMDEALRHHARIIPIDSEQSAIFQCLEGQKSRPVFVHLTASGGPLREVRSKDFKRITPKDVLRHPRWKMGPKITVDSATMMNKGFEVIEAKHLFNLSYSQIKVLVHPEAIVHSMVEFADGSLLAQLGITDMRLPIQYALTYPDRLPTGLNRLNLAETGALNFYEPDLKRFPALGLAFEAARLAGSVPTVLNAADEEAVEAFLLGRIDFLSIYKVVEKVVLRHTIVKNPSLQAILQTDKWARQEAQNIMEYHLA
ncbi:MAG: 1-deoxy-D-xylulose-5-phosphate reductoisomerase [Candidatus Omnitrophica bacterium]|nr:1-deoxy-D-xylulose-5-phosphate reductoisomerase [Candidatus Omnitrophota bacterium]